MLTEDQMGDTLREELDALVADLTPRAAMADRAVSACRARRRRIGIAGAGAVSAAAAAVTIAVTGGLVAGAPRSGAGDLAGPKLRLSSYRFSLPRDAQPVAATPAACALPAIVTFPDASGASTAGTGAGAADQPAIASAITGRRGCVHMLLSDPYLPGGVNTPREGLPIVDSSSITIDGDSGTVGTVEFLGGKATNGRGTTIANGTRNAMLTLVIPAAHGRHQLLLVTAAGVSEQQLQSIVASGLRR